MSKTLQSQKVAVLMSNGFSETDFLAMQKAMIEQGASLRIVSVDSGLVNGWDGKGWGHNFAVDTALNSALGIDYDILVIPGGARSLDKLKMTAHSRRFIGSFLAAMKPVLVMGDAVALLAHTGHVQGHTVSGPDTVKAAVEAAGGQYSVEAMTYSENLVTGRTDGDHLASYIQGSLEMAASAAESLKQAA